MKRKHAKRIPLVERQLWQACTTGDVELAKCMLDTRDMSAADILPAFYQACEYGHLDCVKLLVAHGADAFGANEFENGFAYACAGGRKGLLDYFFQQNICALEAGVWNACHNGRTEMMGMLICYTSRSAVHACTPCRLGETCPEMNDCIFAHLNAVRTDKHKK